MKTFKGPACTWAERHTSWSVRQGCTGRPGLLWTCYITSNAVWVAWVWLHQAKMLTKGTLLLSWFVHIDGVWNHLQSNAVKLKTYKSICQSVALLQHARLGQASLWDWKDNENDSQCCLAFTYGLKKVMEHLLMIPTKTKFKWWHK